jgi:hypothetical protein
MEMTYTTIEKLEGEIAPYFQFWCGCVNVSKQMIVFTL